MSGEKKVADRLLAEVTVKHPAEDKPEAWAKMTPQQRGEAINASERRRKVLVDKQNARLGALEPSYDGEPTEKGQQLGLQEANIQYRDRERETLESDEELAGIAAQAAVKAIKSNRQRKVSAPKGGT